MTARAWPMLLAGVLLAPLVTWLPMLQMKYPALGLPHYPDPAQGLDLWHMQAFWLTACAVIAVIVGQQDKWLGVAVAITGLTIFWRGAYVNPTHTGFFAFGALALCAVRQTPTRWHPMVRDLLAASGAFQALYILQQAWFAYDVLWGPFFGGRLNTVIQPLGTLGTVAAAGAYVAITTPLMPRWLMPLGIVAVWTTHSLAAILALAVALLVKYGRPPHLARWGRVGIVVACTVAPVYAILTRSYVGHGHVGLEQTVVTRALVWWKSITIALTHSPTLGLGLGGYENLRVFQGPEIFLQAHSEPVQWVCELGLVGLVLLGLWLFNHRQMFVSPMWGASVAALAVESSAFFPFHVVSLGLLGIAVVGLADSHYSQGEAPCRS